MPVMDGFELCKTIKSDLNYSHIPVILLTAKTNIQSKIEGMELGADAYIEKPFSVEYLQACASNLIQNREKLRRTFAQSPFVAANTMALTKADEDFIKRQMCIRDRTYTDSNERTLLTVSVNGEDSLATYYVYDDRNCLRYVLPPEASHRLAEAGTTDISVLHSLAYSYEYDKLNRMISKRLPGCAPIYMVYDRRDRLVLSQDGTRRTAAVSYTHLNKMILVNICISIYYMIIFILTNLLTHISEIACIAENKPLYLQCQ